MRYTVTKQVIDVIGSLWMGGTAAMSYTLSPYDMKNLGDASDRDAVTEWLGMHSGDFQSVTDFRADFTITDPSGNATRDIIHDWKDEDSECTFTDCMYPQAEED